MKTRTTILSLAALATLSLSALAPSQALAWGRGGHGYGHHFGGYGHHGWGHRGWGHRYGYGWGHRYGYGWGHRYYGGYRWGGYRTYGGYSYGGYSEAPRVERVYVPVEVPVRVEVPVPVRVPVREESCGCETSYAPPPPPVQESCNSCEGPTQTYAPARMPMREGMMPRRRSFQDSQDLASSELEKQ